MTRQGRYWSKGGNAAMLGLKRDKRDVHRILIVEDEPLVAADN